MTWLHIAHAAQPSKKNIAFRRKEAMFEVRVEVNTNKTDKGWSQKYEKNTSTHATFIARELFFPLQSVCDQVEL